MQKVYLLAVFAAMAAIGSAAQAEVTYDTTLATPPGVFFGTGNANGGFTVDSENGVELGLSAHLAVISDVLHPVSTNVYEVPEGAEPGKPTRASWNTNFSINVGSGSSLTDYIATLQVKDTTTNTVLTTWDVLGNDTAAIPHVTDDSLYNGTVHTGLASGDYVAQNSENAAFFSGFNIGSSDDYLVTLSLYTNDSGSPGSLVASDSIVVALPTPLPSAASMGRGMLGVIGAAGLLRKKLRTV